MNDQQDLHANDAIAAPALLPLRALHCLLFSAAEDNRRANVLRQRSAGEHNRNQLRRSRRMGVASRITAAEARDMVSEVRA